MARRSEIPSALFFRNARQVLTLAGAPVPRRGRDLEHLGIIENGAVLTAGAEILRAGPTASLEKESSRLKAKAIDCRGRIVMPGFVDCHTHLVFAGNRLDDYESRIRGKSSQEIAARGGGIQLSARLLKKASQKELVTQAGTFLQQFVAHGTTTLEVKTGYGLDVPNELKILEVLRRLRKASPLELVPTLLAAHALPPAFAGKRAEYVRMMEERLLPRVARAKLAEFVDCFCDRGAFALPECRTLLSAGARLGLIPRIHAEQIEHTKASRLAVELRAASADHLDHISSTEVNALAQSNVTAVLLPGCNMHTATQSWAPARRLIDRGAIVALATDFNPGTCPTLNMQLILSLACAWMRMTPAEAISAATINAAFSLRRADRIGTLEPGKQADLVVMDVDDYRAIPYYFGWNHCAMTVKRGEIISRSPGNTASRSAATRRR